MTHWNEWHYYFATLACRACGNAGRWRTKQLGALITATCRECGHTEIRATDKEETKG